MKNFLLLLTAIVTLSSCNFYKPAVINAPVFEERGEAELGVSVGNGTDITAAFAITDHIALSGRYTSNINLNSEITVNDTAVSDFDAPNYNYEFAVGYFNSDEKFNYSIYTGYLIGKTASLNEDFLTTGEDLSIAADMSSIFVQASGFAYIDDESSIGLVTRINFLEFDNFTSSEFLTNNTMSFAPGNKSQFVGQVGLQYNLKLEKFGLMSQLQYSFSGSTDNYFTVRKLGLHFGAYIRVGEFFRH